VTETDRSLPGDTLEHLDEMTCMLYLERQLDRTRGQEISQHVQGCSQCRTLLRAMDHESRLLTRAMLEEEEPLPSRLAQFQDRARRSMQWIWGVALGLAATGIYALYTGYVEPWQSQLDQAGFGGSNLLSLLIFQGAFWKGWQSVITLLEVLAMLTLAGFGLAFFRRRARRGSAFALVLAGFCAFAALAVAPAATASETRKGNFVEIKEDEHIKGDVFLFGERVRVNGIVDGDVFVFSTDATIAGHVNGDVIAFAQSLHVSGEVDGNIRSFNNNLTITGTVTRNLTIFDETLNLDSASKIGGSVTSFTKSLNLDGKVGRDLLLFGEHIGIAGTVGGGIQARGRTLSISSGAQVQGPISFTGDEQPEVSSQAKLASPVDFHKAEHKPRYTEGSVYIWQIIWVAAFILFGLVLFNLMPGFCREAVANAERYGASSGLGVLVLFGLPIAAIIACVTVVGLFIGVSTLFIWFECLHFAQIIVGTLVGQWLLGRTSHVWPLIGRMAIGVVVVRICTNIPFAGPWIKFGVIVWGFGAIALAVYRRVERRSGVAPLAPSQPLMPPLPPTTTIGGAQLA
jgi:cytoskeletal protein CcmA (bactofilin family)